MSSRTASSGATSCASRCSPRSSPPTSRRSLARSTTCSIGCNTRAVEMRDGLVAVVKRECPTCELVAPVLAQLHAEVPLTIYSQDDPAFPGGLGAHDDRELDVSFALHIDTVPTLVR